MTNTLQSLREQLDQIDQKVVECLAQRQSVVQQVAQYKKSSNTAPIQDVQREENLLSRIQELSQQAGLDGHFVEKLYKEILQYSLRSQQESLVDQQNPGRKKQRVMVSYQGTDGAYSHLAGMNHFAPRDVEPTFRGFDTFQEMLEAVQHGAADYAMLPIENTTAGSINQAYDLLARMDLKLVGEEIQPVDHCLVTLKPVPITHIRRIFSHPQALAQCSYYLNQLKHAKVEAFTDTAMAVKRVRDEKDLSQAAIASAEAAKIYGLHIVKQGIANQRQNYTRFVIASASSIEVDARIPCKTSLVMSTKHEDGALAKCLGVLASHQLNLTKLESRPKPNNPWEYLFYLDFEGNIAQEDTQKALKELKQFTKDIKVLGSYPARTIKPKASQQNQSLD